MKAKTVKETLIATRWIIDNVGWCQYLSYQLKGGNIHDSSCFPIEKVLEKGITACCLGGAIRLVEATDNILIEKARYLLQEAMSTYVGHTYIAEWNDTPGRTKQEVLDLLDGVIAKLP